ncbi:L-lactate permease [Haloimpatiens sp. FM7330]|uniref:L-lactate permease n=1 Tax=Haloimpatiens sp. FM7330 TaxID=3298610 RepID=UPI00364028C4
MNSYLLCLVALIPIIWLMVSLGILKLPAHKTCTATLVLTLVLAMFVWKMPLTSAFTAALEGTALGLWPIMIVIMAAVFTYNVSLHTNSMETIKKILSNITTDERILVLILAWGFGGFLEAVAGFGTAVAIPASILAAMGLDPIFASVICLIANTVPTAFGAIGIPVTTLAKVAGLDVNVLSYTTAIQLTLFIVIIPLVLVILTAKSIRGVKGVIGISLASGIAFAIPQLLAAKYMGAELPALLGSISSMAVTIFLAKKFHKENKNKNNKNKDISFKEGVIAWMPYILIFTFIILSSSLFPSIKSALESISTSLYIYNGQGAKPFVFKWIATPGVLIIIAAFIGGMIQGAKFVNLVKVLIDTMKQLTKSAITVLSIVALAKVMGYSGMIDSIAQILAKVTGRFFPFISPIIGALGTFVTGSDTSSNVLFGQLQVNVANSINANPYWLTAANAAGATAGKMISPQSIAVATAATGLVGSEGKIFNKTLKFCIVYVIVLGVMVLIGGNFINLLIH